MITISKIYYITKEMISLDLKDNNNYKYEKNNNLVRETPQLIEILLKDRTTRKNIIWGTDSYLKMGKEYHSEDPIKASLVTNGAGDLIKPRSKKAKEEQKLRTKGKAEVFTPTWVVKKQNDVIEDEFQILDLEEYVNKKWLEIACGEAPYMCSRYDTVSEKFLALENRIGFVDRKLQRISKEINNHNEWLELVYKAYKSSYGYEFQGDSLLLARENLLYTFIDYYEDKFKKQPKIGYLLEIAKIISYNVFQMDGLRYIIPFTEVTETRELDTQLDLFEEPDSEVTVEKIIIAGTKVKIKNWKNNRMIKFEDIVDNEGGRGMKFDVVIGNPPYQEDIERTSARQIYPNFMNSSFVIGSKVLLITPARFLFNAGKTPKEWNKKMLNDPFLSVLFYEPSSSNVFANTDIKGGVAITYRDVYKKREPIGVFTSYEELTHIVNKVSNFYNGNIISINTIMYGQSRFNLDVLYSDYPEIRDSIGSNGKERRLTTSIFNVIPEIFEDEKSDVYNVSILGRSENRRIYKYVNDKYLVKRINSNKWKVLLPKANGTGALGEALSSPVVEGPGVGNTHTFISIGSFDSEDEAKSCMKYIKSKTTRILLGVLKVTQDNLPNSWSYVPLQDFTPNSDIDWTKSIAEIDQQLYKKYGLNQEEIDFIETNVKEME